jgi:hypothetical protein
LAQVAVPIIKALELVQGSRNKELKQLLSEAFKITTQSMSQNTTLRRDRIKKRWEVEG